jgi:hypothetical protein
VSMATTATENAAEENAAEADVSTDGEAAQTAHETDGKTDTKPAPPPSVVTEKDEEPAQATTPTKVDSDEPVERVKGVESEGVAAA